MMVQSWHIPITEKVPFTEIKERLLNKGLISVVDEAGKVFQKFTVPLGLNISLPIMKLASSDLLISVDNDALCYIELIEELEEIHCLNLIITSKDESSGSQLLAECKSVWGDEKAIKGTIQEKQIAESLRGQLKEGTHGRFLGDPEFTSSFDVLYDRTLREQLRIFAKRFGDSGVSEAIADDILSERGKLKKSEIRQLINNENLFSKQFSIGCKECGASTLNFSTREEAEESLSHSISRRCFLCEENTLEVVEAFALKDPLLKGLEGLWLEHLVRQISQPVSLLSMAGMMLENFELDVISVTCEKVILFECKDTSFGGNDFLVSVAKAQELNADILWIVTTQPLHENVKKDVERREERERFDIFITDNLDDKQSITSAISQKVEQVQNDFLTNLFTRESELYRLPPSLRRRLLRRPPRRF